MEILAPRYIFGILRSVWTFIWKESEVIDGEPSVAGGALDVQSEVSVGVHGDLASVPLGPRRVEPGGRQIPDRRMIAVLIIVVSGVDRFLVDSHAGGVGGSKWRKPE